MRSLLCLSLPLLLLSCVGTKDFTVHTSPEGADVSINGKDVGRSPVTTKIKQDKDLGIVAVKPGYEAASETVATTSNWWLRLLWTANDPKARYIEADEVNIPLKREATPQSYEATPMPAFTPPASFQKLKPTAAPASGGIPKLKPLPQLP